MSHLPQGSGRFERERYRALRDASAQRPLGNSNPHPSGSMPPPTTRGTKRPREDSEAAYITSGRETIQLNASRQPHPSPNTNRRENHASRDETTTDVLRSPPTERPPLSIAQRTNQAALPDFSISMPTRGPPIPTQLAWECNNSSREPGPPTRRPESVNAAVHRQTRALPTGIRPRGAAALPGDFFPGGVVWASHQATALDRNANPLQNRDFVQTNVSVASSKRRMFFVDFAHDFTGILAYPMFTHGGNGLERVPELEHRYHIPVLDWHDRVTNPEHSQYRPIYVKLHGTQPVRKNSYIDISAPYQLNFRETIDAAGYSTEQDAEYVFENADRLRDQARRATKAFANREKLQPRPNRR